MEVTHTWLISQMDCYPEQDGLSDVVFTIHWRLNATDGTYTGTAYGTVGVTLDPEAPYTPYDKLTHEQVIGWVQDTLGQEQVAAYESGVAQRIAIQIKPLVVTPPLPWTV